MEPEIFTVYVLYSEQHNKHYTGYTNNLLNRFLSHNSLGKDWTKSFRPWIVIYTEIFHNKAGAKAREAWLKTGAGRDFIKTLPHTF